MEKNERPKKKFKKIKIGYILAFIVIVAFCVLVLKLVLPASGINKYGDRLEGIEKSKFTEKEEKKIIKNLKEKEQVISSSIDVKGRLIYVNFTVKKDTSIDDSKNIANESLGLFSDKVKSYYDIQYSIKKKDEEGRKETINEEEVTVYDFPIMGYKNKKAEGLAW